LQIQHPIKPRESDPEIKLVRSLCESGRTLLETKTEVSEFTIAMLESSRSMIAFEAWPMQARMLARMFDTFGAAVPVEAVALWYTPGVTAMRALESDPGRSTIGESTLVNLTADQTSDLRV
jgi:hypothetical protein